MSATLLCKRICFPLLLLVAFYLGGVAATMFETWHQSLLMSCGVFTAVFASVVATGAKIYHLMFL